VIGKKQQLVELGIVVVGVAAAGAVVYYGFKQVQYGAIVSLKEAARPSSRSEIDSTAWAVTMMWMGWYLLGACIGILGGPCAFAAVVGLAGIGLRWWMPDARWVLLPRVLSRVPRIGPYITKRVFVADGPGE
jgi:hypothetical protein